MTNEKDFYFNKFKPESFLWSKPHKRYSASDFYSLGSIKLGLEQVCLPHNE